VIVAGLRRRMWGKDQSWPWVGPGLLAIVARGRWGRIVRDCRHACRHACRDPRFARTSAIYVRFCVLCMLWPLGISDAGDLGAAGRLLQAAFNTVLLHGQWTQ
jgi:hypothetical protein